MNALEVLQIGTAAEVTLLVKAMDCAVGDQVPVEAMVDDPTSGWFDFHPEVGGLPAGWKLVGAGETRTVFLAPSGCVYKVGSNSANRAEHRFLTEARAQGYAWAPATTRYDRLGWDGWEGERDLVIVAMEHIVGDGSTMTNGPEIFGALCAAGDINYDNVIVRGGIGYLVDGAGMTGYQG